MSREKQTKNPHHRRESGQAFVEYLLIFSLVGLAFGLALAATGPVIGSVFTNSVNVVLKQTPVGTIPNREDFWATATAAALVDLAYPPKATNTPGAATLTATPEGGMIEVTPPTLTPQPQPTNVAPDLIHVAIDNNIPWRDTVDNPEWWRLDRSYAWDIANFADKSEFWDAFYYPNLDFDGDALNFPRSIRYINFIDPPNIPLPWSTGIQVPNWPNPADPGKDFSVRYQRGLTFLPGQERGLRFTMRIKGASPNARFYIQGGNTCPGTQRPEGCELINLPQGNVLEDIATYNFQAGINYTLIVEYKQLTPEDGIRFDIETNDLITDDTYVDGSGNQSNDTNFACDWGRTKGPEDDGNDANTELYYFDEFLDGSQPGNSRCHLELRGLVKVPANVTNPQFIFWNVWDLDNETKAYVEFGEYRRARPEDPPLLNRAGMNWRRVPIHTAAGTNFNYTRRAINLNANEVFGGGFFGTAEKEITFRFVLETRGNANADKHLWNVDDISFRLAGAGTIIVEDGKQWTLNDFNQRDDFFYTGGTSNIGSTGDGGVVSGWNLVGDRYFGTSGMSFHESVNPNDAQPNTPYKMHSASDATNNIADIGNLRVHALEINQWINIESQNFETPDKWDNRGDPTLSFYQAYDLGRGVALQVQYTTDEYTAANVTWRALPRGGEIRGLDAPAMQQAALQEYEVPLKREDIPSQPNRIRVRFAMLVSREAELADGWWIDHIRLGRGKAKQWLDYPFVDSAQGQEAPWQFTGTWQPTLKQGRGVPGTPDDALTNPDGTPYKRRSYGSSPDEPYPNGPTYMQTKFPIDFFNDTPQKWIFGREAPPLAGPFHQNSYVQPAKMPVLTFFHKRNINKDDTFIISWRRESEATTAWKTLWEKRYNRPTIQSSQQLAWERVEIDLSGLMHTLNTSNNAAITNDDDILFRFELRADANDNAEGLYIDDIEIIERMESNGPEGNPGEPNKFVDYRRVWNLWEAGQAKTVQGSADPVAGSGVFYRDEPDISGFSRGWWENWEVGGDWTAVQFGAYQRAGIFAFHESPVDQVGNQQGVVDPAFPFDGGAPVGRVIRLAPNNSYYQAFDEDRADEQVYPQGNPSFYTQDNTMSILELDTIIDMRGADYNRNPTLTFWHRYHLGKNVKFRIEVSKEVRLTAAQRANDAQRNTLLDQQVNTACNLAAGVQCYDNIRGWLPWQMVYSNSGFEKGSDAGVTAESRGYAYTRVMVPLRDFAGVNNNTTSQGGDRIRIRFVLDTLDDNTDPNRDGWYLDNISIGYYDLAEVNINSGEPFIDVANTMDNWIAEGAWGLDPSLSLTGGGSSVILGEWNYIWKQCNNCNGTNAANVLANAAAPITNQGSTFIVSNSFSFNGAPYQGGPSSNLAAQYTLDTGTVNGNGPVRPGTYSFVTRSDDGIRVKIETWNGTAFVPDPTNEWNIINNFSSHPPTIDAGTAILVSGQRYRIILQYFQGTGGAALSLTTGTGAFSFSDSPKQGRGQTYEDVPMVPFSNSSLISRKVFNLQGIPDNQVVLLSYDTKYRLGEQPPGQGTIKRGGRAFVEVSQDGGFTWTNNNLRNSVTIGGTTRNMADTNFSSVYGFDNNQGWQTRENNLTSYKGRKILIRFRLDTQIDSCARRGTCELGSNVTSTTIRQDAYYNGWWIGRVVVSAQ